jgi:hypothetical protein
LKNTEREKERERGREEREVKDLDEKRLRKKRQYMAGIRNNMTERHKKGYR